MSIRWTTFPDDEYLRVEFDGKPGYINIKADDNGFVVEVFPDVGNDPVSATWATYNELEADENVDAKIHRP